jgi:hypothetical protein
MNAPEITSFVNVVNEVAKTDRDNVSTRIAKRLSTSTPWPPTQVETHLQIRSYQKWLESYFPGRINRGGLGHLWAEAYKRTEEVAPAKEDNPQIDIEDQIAAQAAEMIAPKKYSKSADMSNHKYQRHEKDLIKEMFADGATDAEIGEVLGRSEEGIKYQRRKMKLSSYKRKRWTQADDVALEALLAKGYKHQPIAAKLGRTLDAIQARACHLGLTRGKRFQLLPKPAPLPTPPPAPPVQPAPPKAADPKPMTKSLPWWRRIFG